MNERRPRVIKFVLNLLLLVLPLLYLAYVIADRLGTWDEFVGLNLVEQVAQSFELSYAPDASHPIMIGDRAWKPLLSIIKRYSRARLPEGKQPRMVVRYQAIASGRVPSSGPLLGEWTAPTTPFLLVFKDYAIGSQAAFSNDDVLIVGTIGDLREWISKAKEYRRFLVQDVFLGTFTPLLGFALFLIDWKRERS